MADGGASGTGAAIGAPPHDLDAERSVLGAILVDGLDSLGEVEAVVTPADFYHPAHATIFAAACAVKARGEPVDVVTIAAELRSRDKLGTVGDTRYLGDLSDAVVTLAHLEQHARIVADLAQLRRVVATVQQIAARALGQRGPVAEFVAWAEKATMAACERQTRTGLRPLRDFLEQSFARIEQQGGDVAPGMLTGFHDIDALTHGLHGGQLIVVAARPRMGKSSIALNVIDHVARNGTPVAMWSQEMPGREYSDRQLASTARVDQSSIRGLKLSQDDMAGITAAAGELFTRPIWIDEGCGITLSEIAAKSRRAKQRDGLGLIVIDHLGLMDHQRGRDESTSDAIGRTTRGLKSLAKELDVPVMLLSQLNRECDKRPAHDRRPQLSDLRDSGNIEQDADVVWFLYRDEIYNPASPDKGIAEVNIAKQRNGAEGVVRLKFTGPLTLFESLAEDDPQRAQPEAPARRERRPRGGQRQYPAPFGGES